jgi:hypothetical protein
MIGVAVMEKCLCSAGDNCNDEPVSGIGNPTAGSEGKDHTSGSDDQPFPSYDLTAADQLSDLR